MTTINTSEGSIELADSIVEAVTRNAEFTADLTAKAIRLVVPKESQYHLYLPANFLLEFGASLHIRYWELHEISVHVEAGLPSYAVASQQLAERAQMGPAEFSGGDAAPLSKKVLLFWIDNFAWDGPALLGADIVSGEVNEDQFLDLAAEFLWKNRHALQELLLIEETDNDQK